jgi:hypothetical protein
VGRASWSNANPDCETFRANHGINAWTTAWPGLTNCKQSSCMMSLAERLGFYLSTRAILLLFKHMPTNLSYYSVLRQVSPDSRGCMRCCWKPIRHCFRYHWYHCLTVSTDSANRPTVEPSSNGRYGGSRAKCVEAKCNGHCFLDLLNYRRTARAVTQFVHEC